MRRYDIIIIGSGLGALECGCLLSQQGRSVLILERQLQPGGCMQSYIRKGKAFDTGLHYVGGLDEGQPLHAAFSQLGLLDLPWKRLDPQFDIITIGKDTYHFTQGYTGFADSLSEHFPRERQELIRYTDLMRQADEDQLKALTSPSPPEESLNDTLFSTNAYGWLKERFSERLLNVLSGTSLKMELRKDTLPLFTFLHGNSSFIQSSWRLDGPGNMLVGKLIDNIRGNGGEVLCHSEVTELIEKDGRIAAALCSNGERYEADIFISNLHPALTCSLVRESRVMRNVYRRRMNSLENTYGFFTASLSLRKDSLPYVNHNRFVYDTSDVWSVSEDPTAHGLLISMPAHGDQVDLLMPMLREEFASWEDTPVGHRGDGYLAMKRNKAEACIRMAESVMPGLTDAIDEVYTSTPLTYRDYNLTPEGSAYGIRKNCNAPMMTILTPRTPIPNLLMTGQNLMLHGLHGVTMTALFTCAEINRMT